MTTSMTMQVLTCLMLYTTCAHAIMVKFGTKQGPIEPPAPDPSLPPSQPYRIPAPVWEERSNDTPDPNAQWRPQLFVPQQRYTQVIYNSPGALSRQPLNNAQKFVNSYRPQNQEKTNIQHHPIPAHPITNYFTPSQIVSQLSSQVLPGLGTRYFLPDYIQKLQAKKEEEIQNDNLKNKHLETNNIDDEENEEFAHSNQLRRSQKEKQSRFDQITKESIVQYVYQWPAYVPAKH